MSNGRWWIFLDDDFDRRDKAVADFWDGLHIAGIFRRVTEGGAKFLDGTVETVLEIDDGVRAPQADTHLLPGNDLAGGFQQHQKKGEGLAGQADAKAVFAELVSCGVELKHTESVMLPSDHLEIILDPAWREHEMPGRT